MVMSRFQMTTLLVTSAFAADRFVATDGNDDNPGTKDKPFGSVGTCVKASQPGDVCQIRGGTYVQDKASFSMDEPPPSKPVEPITVTAFGNEKVRFSGVKRLNMQWSKVAGTKCVYSAHVSTPVWQLFVGDEMQTSARWPNAYWKDMSIFDHEKAYVEGDEKESSCGTTAGIQALAEYTKSTGVDVSGSLAVMNIGSWISYTLPVTQTADDTLTYKCPNPIKRDSTRFFLEGKLEFVDSETEWAYDPKADEIHFWPEGCEDPNKLQVYGKVDSYFVSGSKSYLTFQNIEFFGLTFNLEQSEALTIESCSFKYPVYNRRMLGETGVQSSRWFKSKGLNFVNNTVAYTDGQFLSQKQSQNSTFENNYFHHLDWSCAGEASGGNHAGVLNLNSWDIFRWNTAHDIGPASGIRAEEGTLIEYNLLHDLYNLQNDGALVQMGSSKPAGRCRFNWAYNSAKRSFRYDRVNSPDSAKSAAGGLLHGNLAWNASAIFVKGDEHTVTNNVAWSPVTKGVPDISGTEMALVVLGPGETPYAFDFENTHTTVSRNGAPSMGCGAKNHSFAGPGGDNVEAKVEEQLVDVHSRDFRPKAGSSFAAAGVGPYKSDGSDYFIPGQQLHMASHPIPTDGTKAVPTTSTLLFRAGFRAQDHAVYLAEVGSQLKQVSLQATSGHAGALMAEPSLLKSGTTYQWRVVAKHATHDIHGPTWTFTTESGDETGVIVV